jgi:hypothetical protein
MPLKLNVGASKKVGEANYGSRGASVNVEMELDSALVNDPPRLQERIRQLFGLVRASLAEELNGNGHGNGNGGAKPANNNGAHHQPAPPPAPPRQATSSQIKAIFAIARAKQINVHSLLRQRFQVGRPDDLDIKQASNLIDELKGSGDGQDG